ncbi:hypothetical protein Sste5346_005247 [Sporothrix stenoceras]|uniref:DUF1330 domain-containing protein n=1 Tax=Sporothrix stenoceras TaxID=5173 RepID=A0ABR3Z481_9PEZI
MDDNMDDNIDKTGGEPRLDIPPSPPPDGYDFRSLVPPTTVRPVKWTEIGPAHIIKDAFKLHTLLAIGAGLQMAFAAAVPTPWCMLPAAALLVLAPTITVVQILLPTIRFRGRRLTHPFLSGIIPGRSTAHIPSPTTGRYSPHPGQGLVVFHFGARFNHPLGVFAPGAQAMTRRFRDTLASLEDKRTEYGLLGGDLFRGGNAARTSNDTILLVLDFRDVSGLQRFAASPVHREAYEWLRQTTADGKYSHLSAFHETFVVPAGHYESLYINTAPILLGNTHTESDSERSEDTERVWLSSLVDADDERLRTMTARLKRSL